MAIHKLTIRHGARVRRERFEALDDALLALRMAAEAVLAEGPLGAASAFRDYEPGQRVAGRLELSVGGFLRGREAGLDVMGDGAVVPYTGAVRKERLPASSLEQAVEAIRRELGG